MEGLILLFAEFLSALLAPVITIVASSIASALGLCAMFMFELIALVVHVLTGRRMPPTAQSDLSAQSMQSSKNSLRPQRTSRRWLRWLRNTALSLCVLLVLGLVALECGLDRVLIRAALDRMAERGGPRITMTALRVGTFSGAVELDDARIIIDQPQQQADLTCQRMQLELSLWSLLRSELRLPSLSASGVRGRYRVTRDDQVASTTNAITAIAKPVAQQRQPSSRRHFIIERLHLNDVVLDVALQRNGRSASGAVQISQLVTTELANRSLVSGLLLRTTADGSLFGAAFTARTREIADGRETAWQVRDLPAATLAALFGPPWDMLVAGTADIDLSDRWALGDTRAIHLDYAMRLRDVRIVAPDTAQRPTKVIAAAAAALLALKGNTINLRVALEIDRDQFETSMSHDASLLVAAASRALLEQLIPDPTQRKAVEQLSPIIFSGAHSLLDRWRRSAKP